MSLIAIIDKSNFSFLNYISLLSFIKHHNNSLIKLYIINNKTINGNTPISINYTHEIIKSLNSNNINIVYCSSQTQIKYESNVKLDILYNGVDLTTYYSNDVELKQFYYDNNKLNFDKPCNICWNQSSPVSIKYIEEFNNGKYFRKGTAFKYMLEYFPDIKHKEEYKENPEVKLRKEIRDIYRKYLEREPDDYGMNGYLKEIYSGKNIKFVEDEVSNSNEYWSIHLYRMSWRILSKAFDNNTLWKYIKQLRNREKTLIDIEEEIKHDIEIEKEKEKREKEERENIIIREKEKEVKEIYLKIFGDCDIEDVKITHYATLLQNNMITYSELENIFRIKNNIKKQKEAKEKY
jgi:hypothetical protein